MRLSICWNLGEEPIHLAFVNSVSAEAGMPEEAWINSRGVKEHGAACDIYASVHGPSRHCRDAVNITVLRCHDRMYYTHSANLFQQMGRVKYCIPQPRPFWHHGILNQWPHTKTKHTHNSAAKRSQCGCCPTKPPSLEHQRPHLPGGDSQSTRLAEAAERLAAGCRSRSSLLRRCMNSASLVCAAAMCTT